MISVISFWVKSFWRELAADALCPMCKFVSSAHQYCFVFRVSHFIQLGPKTKCFVFAVSVWWCVNDFSRCIRMCVGSAAGSRSHQRWYVCATLLDTCVCVCHCYSCVWAWRVCVNNDSLAAASQTNAKNRTFCVWNFFVQSEIHFVQMTINHSLDSEFEKSRREIIRITHQTKSLIVVNFWYDLYHNKVLEFSDFDLCAVSSSTSMFTRLVADWCSAERLMNKQ